MDELEEALLKVENDVVDHKAASKIGAKFIGVYCIVRCRNAGVHAGVVEQIDGQNVSLTHARRLWYWEAASGHTLSAVATHGLKGGSKLPVPVTVLLTEACEIIECSDEARLSIMGWPVHNE